MGNVILWSIIAFSIWHISKGYNSPKDAPTTEEDETGGI